MENISTDNIVLQLSTPKEEIFRRSKTQGKSRPISLRQIRPIKIQPDDKSYRK